MHTSATQQLLHGALVSVKEKGILIIGPAGIGKSSLAIELLSQGYSLIADDTVHIHTFNDTVIGTCPTLLEKVIHSREIGLISIPSTFGENAWKKQHVIDYVVKLEPDIKHDVDMPIAKNTYEILELLLPFISLSISNPASLSHRILCWLSVHATQHSVEHDFIQKQRIMMS